MEEDAIREKVTAVLSGLTMYIELRGFAPIGMMEFWNDGFEGICLIYMIFSAFTFQYSIIPDERHVETHRIIYYVVEIPRR